MGFTSFFSKDKKSKEKDNEKEKEKEKEKDKRHTIAPSKSTKTATPPPTTNTTSQQQQQQQHRNTIVGVSTTPPNNNSPSSSSPATSPSKLVTPPPPQSITPTSTTTTNTTTNNTNNTNSNNITTTTTTPTNVPTPTPAPTTKENIDTPPPVTSTTTSNVNVTPQPATTTTKPTAPIPAPTTKEPASVPKPIVTDNTKNNDPASVTTTTQPLSTSPNKSTTVEATTTTTTTKPTAPTPATTTTTTTKVSPPKPTTTVSPQQPQQAPLVSSISKPAATTTTTTLASSAPPSTTISKSAPKVAPQLSQSSPAKESTTSTATTTTTTNNQQQPKSNTTTSTTATTTSTTATTTTASPQQLSQSQPSSSSNTNNNSGFKKHPTINVITPHTPHTPSSSSSSSPSISSSSSPSPSLLSTSSPSPSTTSSPAKAPSVPNLNDTIEQKKLAKQGAIATMETQARAWVIDVLKIDPLDESVSFFEHFKNGVLLCKLINTIKPGSVKRINESTIAFKQLENIQNYLKACQAVGLQDVHLFNSIDLHENKDIGLVVTNVLVLGKFAARVEGYDGPHLAGERKNIKITTTPASPLFPNESLQLSKNGDKLLAVDENGKKKWRKSVKRVPSVTPLNLDISAKEAFKYSPELEASASQWIQNVLNQKLPYPESLRQSLKDGILLCKVINRIKPNTIVYINTGKSGFKQMENIANYLYGCQQLGLKKLDLFDTTDLYEEKNFNLVISNIHVLANHVVKAYPDAKIPPIAQSQSGQVYSSIVHSRFGMPGSSCSGSGGELTEEAKELINWINGHLSNRSRDITTSSSGGAIEPCKNIGHDLNNGVILILLLEELTSLRVGIYTRDPSLPWHFMQNISLVLNFMRENATNFNNGSVSAHDIFNGNVASIINLLKIIRENFDREHFFKTVPIDTRRHKVIEEIVITEQTYVKNLSVLFQTLIVPLEALADNGGGISRDDIYSIFGNWEKILKNHALLLKEFEDRMENWNESSTFGDIFIKKCDFLKDTYSQYINNYDNSYSRIKRLRKANKVFDDSVNNFEVYQDSTNGLDLYSYLIMPIQRIPRYLLLLKESIKYTANSHQDFKMLSDAKDTIHQVANHVNESKMMSDNSRKISSIQDSIFNLDFNLDENDRRYIREGFLEIEDTFNKNSYFFLFNDILLFVRYKPSEETGKEFKYKEVFQLSDFNDVCDILSDDEESDQEEEEEEEQQKKPKRVTFAKPPKFEIETSEFSLVLIAESEEEKFAWMEDIRKCLQENLIKDDDQVSDLSLNGDGQGTSDEQEN